MATFTKSICSLLVAGMLFGASYAVLGQTHLHPGWQILGTCGVMLIYVFVLWGIWDE